MSKIKVAVLVENHPYDVVAFQKMLDSFTECECYVQPIDLFIQDEKNMEDYDTVLWYNMNWDEPAEGSFLRDYVENKMGETGQGIILLHHALLSFQGWNVYTRICGLSDRGGDHFSYHQNEHVQQQIILQHPVTEDIEDFDVYDETYSIGEPDQAGNDVLITTDNTSGVHQIAWTRMYKQSRIFCYLSGHDDAVYSNDSFRRLLLRGIKWTSGRI